MLVQDGFANIQARNTENGDVPLHDAASRGHKEVVKELLSLNAPVNPRNNENLVPAQLARANNFVECAEILGKYDTTLFEDFVTEVWPLQKIISVLPLKPTELSGITELWTDTKLNRKSGNTVAKMERFWFAGPKGITQMS